MTAAPFRVRRVAVRDADPAGAGHQRRVPRLGSHRTSRCRGMVTIGRRFPFDTTGKRWRQQKKFFEDVHSNTQCGLLRGGGRYVPVPERPVVAERAPPDYGVVGDTFGGQDAGERAVLHQRAGVVFAGGDDPLYARQARCPAAASVFGSVRAGAVVVVDVVPKNTEEAVDVVDTRETDRLGETRSG